ncbi:MAG: T9SS type A sorting domain-containing protein [Bacteroidota bacterium]
MKHLFFLVFLSGILGTNLLKAQGCPNPTAQIDLDGNALHVRLLNGGDLGWDFSNPSFQPEYNGPLSPSTIFSAGLWMGGIDPAGNLILDAIRYRSDGKPSYWPGPLNITTGSPSSIDCANWNRFFKVTAEDINAFLADLSDGVLSGAHPAIKGWPARNNPFFADVTGFDLPNNHPILAPFHDANNDGQYNPLDGDYPAIKIQGHPEFVPSIQIWYLMNDNGNIDAASGGANIPGEIHVTAFQFNCPGNPVINNTMFTNHRLVSYATQAIDSFSMGLFVDFDLGCFSDDCVGSRPSSHTFYAYNATNLDGPSCSGTYSYGENPPVEAVSFLNTTLDRFININNVSTFTTPVGTTDPQMTVEYYHYLNGHWRDDLPLTQGNNGYNPASSIPATHIFPDDPNNPNGWSMTSSNLPGRDIRGLGTHYVGTLHPGQIQDLTTAWSYHRAPGLNNLQNVTRMFSDVDQIQNLFDNNFTDVCAPFVVSTQQAERHSNLRFAPNPTATQVQVSFGEALSGLMRVFDRTGKLVLEQMIDNQSILKIETSNWANGMYFFEMVSGNKVLSGKLSVAK